LIEYTDLPRTTRSRHKSRPDNRSHNRRRVFQGSHLGGKQKFERPMMTAEVRPLRSRAPCPWSSRRDRSGPAATNARTLSTAFWTLARYNGVPPPGLGKLASAPASNRPATCLAPAQPDASVNRCCHFFSPAPVHATHGDGSPGKPSARGLACAAASTGPAASLVPAEPGWWRLILMVWRFLRSGLTPDCGPRIAMPMSRHGISRVIAVVPRSTLLVWSQS
jgi:hypothetical protein